MKKLLTFLTILALFNFMGYSQNAPIDFEVDGIGADWTWTVFENDTNPPLEIIDNPDMSGINTSARVAKFTALETGNPWAGFESAHGSSDLGPFVLNNSNSTIKVMVWKSVISDVGVKLVSENGWAQPEILVANTLINEWEEITFDFSDFDNPPPSEGEYDQIVIFGDYDLDGREEDNVVYIDNITFSEAVLQDEPDMAAPSPLENADDVISMFSDVYEDVEVDTWRTPWSSAQLEDIEIQGNPTKKYTALDFVGIETTGDNLIDATEMEYFHIDVWTPNMDIIRIKLVDFGADGEFGGGDDTEHEIVLDDLAHGQWHSLQIPLSDFEGLGSTANLAQYILSGTPTGEGTLYVDNVYFSGEVVGPGDEPLTAAPDPTEDADDVISMFSDVYEDVAVDTWRTPWSSAELEDIEIAGNATKKYSMLDFVGIETTGDNLIDASEMVYFHIDVWTPNMDVIRIKLVDFGADGEFGGGDDTEHEIVLDDLAHGQWHSLQIPLSDFEGLGSTANLAQYILSGTPTGEGTLYVDNVYFSGEVVGPGDEPLVAAPDPTEDSDGVISLFSDVYEDVAVDTWRTPWSSAELEDIEIAGNATKKYSMLDFVGIETTGPNLINASNMEFFHIDVWTPNMDVIRIKLVDFGPDGQFGGGDDSEHEIVFENLAQGEWHSLQIPLDSFSGLMGKENMAQYILSGIPVGEGTLYVDNVYFSGEAVDPGDEPLAPAPDPTEDSENVISMFSDVYEDVEVDTWRTPWSSAELEDIEIAGNATKKYSMLDFVGIETTGDNLIDASEMDFFHIDVWSPNMDIFRVKLVDFGPDGEFGGGDDSEHEVVFSSLTKGVWHSLQIPLDSFVGLENRDNIAQLIFSGTPVGEGTLYVDNVYYSRSTVGPGDDEPLVPAPDPTENSENVISLFSDVYEDVEVDTWRTPWSSAQLEDIEILGNPTKKYTMLDFVGIETTGDNLVDATEMEYFHIDVWTPNMDIVRVKLVDFGADGQFGGGDDTEHEIVFDDLAKGEWHSLQIPLSDFEGLASTANLAQYILSGTPVGQGILFVDNVYFSKTPTSVVDIDENSFRIFPNPAANVLNIEGSSVINRLVIFNSLGQRVHYAENPDSTIDISRLTTGIYIFVIESEGGIYTERLMVK